ncbi:MAG TPA: hypothetical protein VKR30_07870 [Candidatus Limnocylindrales bacterium]|nr:hypothetical protein [Candidatus Limnocylindrales bacterium]
MTGWSGSEAGRAIIGAAEAILADAVARDRSLDGGRIAAIAWATVDLDRAEQELGAALGVELAARPSARERKLGARVRSASPFADGPALLLLEPDTEGRLAAILARRGEGVALVVVEAGYRTRRLVVTSDRGGPPRRAPSDRLPSAGG